MFIHIIYHKYIFIYTHIFILRYLYSSTVCPALMDQSTPAEAKVHVGCHIYVYTCVHSYTSCIINVYFSTHTYWYIDNYSLQQFALLSWIHPLLPTHCNTLQHTATPCNTLQHTYSTLADTLQHTATHCNTRIPLLPTHCNALQHTATHCNTLRHTYSTLADTLQHTATHCNTLQHTATHVFHSCRHIPAIKTLPHTTEATPHCLRCVYGVAYVK